MASEILFLGKVERNEIQRFGKDRGWHEAESRLPGYEGGKTLKAFGQDVAEHKYTS